MALENYRITEFQEKTQVDNGDYVLIDSATDGTHKYQLSRIPAQASAEVAAAVAAEETAREAADAAEVTARNAAISAAISEEVTARNAAISANVDDTLTVSGKAADAKKTGDEIADVKSDLTAEETARANADTALGNAITAETTARKGAVSALAGDVEADYAKKDGSYADMTAGNADQLLSTVEAVDSVPYQYRTSGGTADIGDREYDTIVGGTVAWNQQAKEINSQNWSAESGVTATFNDNKIVFTSPSVNYGVKTSLGNSFLPNHVYLASAFVKAASACSIGFLFGSLHGVMSVTSVDTTEKQIGSLAKTASNTSGQGFFIAALSGSANVEITAKAVVVFDLTQMFGSTIADYIYSLETATAGAGVAFFRSLFPNNYYPYDAGSLKSVEGVSAHETVGFNQWDEVWELGLINDTTGENVEWTSNIRSKNYIPAIGGLTYYFHVGTDALIRVFVYDENRTPIVLSNGNIYFDIRNETKVLPSNVRYLRFSTYNAYGATYKNDICINLSSSRNGEYEAYSKHSYPLDSTLTLRGIPKLDASNHICYDGDTYEADGTVTRRYGIVDLGTLDWTYDSSVPRFYTSGISSLSAKYKGNVVPNAVVVGYTATSLNVIYNNPVSGMFCISIDGFITMINMAYSTSAAFKTAMSGVYLIYELATPTTEEADPYQSPQIVDDFGTEEYVTTSIVPVGHYTKYPENLRAKIEGLPWDFSTLIAPTEKTNTATRNYTSGSLLIMRNVLYKVTANIANGGTITPGTNVTATTLSEVISALS